MTNLIHMKIQYFLLPLLFLFGCDAPEPQVPETGGIEPKTTPKGAFLGMTPSESPQLLAPEHLASLLTEYNGTFNPEGTEFYYTAEAAGQGLIMETHMEADSHWSSPRVASFSGQYSEYDPLFSPDGYKLFFSSERPTPDHPEGGLTNIWAIQQNGGRGWSEPFLIPLTGKGDYFSSLDKQGNLYFNVWSDGDIYKGEPNLTGYEFAPLPAQINGRTDVGDPFISAEGDYLIFRGFFKEGYGRGDLYISFAVTDPQTEGMGAWSEPINLGPEINSKAQEMTPYVTTDGKWFVFASDRLLENHTFQAGSGIENAIRKAQSYDNGRQNIYYCSADFIHALREQASSDD